MKMHGLLMPQRLLLWRGSFGLALGVMLLVTTLAVSPLAVFFLCLSFVIVGMAVWDLRDYKRQQGLYLANKQEFDTHLLLRHQIVDECERIARGGMWQSGHIRSNGKVRFKRLAFGGPMIIAVKPDDIAELTMYKQFLVDSYPNRPIVSRMYFNDSTGADMNEVFDRKHFAAEMESPVDHRASVEELRQLLAFMRSK